MNHPTHVLFEAGEPDCPEPVAEWGAGICRKCGRAEIELMSPCPHLIENALENLLIAIGMGWDLEGVLEIAQSALEAYRANPPQR